MALFPSVVVQRPRDLFIKLEQSSLASSRRARTPQRERERVRVCVCVVACKRASKQARAGESALYAHNQRKREREHCMMSKVASSQRSLDGCRVQQQHSPADYFAELVDVVEEHFVVGHSGAGNDSSTLLR